MSIEAMKLALEALERYCTPYADGTHPADEAIVSLRQAIEQAEKQEPVALQMDVIVVNLVREGINKHRARELAEHFIKHTAPQPQREWVEVECPLCGEMAVAHTHPNLKKREWVGLTDGLKVILIKNAPNWTVIQLIEETELLLKDQNT